MFLFRPFYIYFVSKIFTFFVLLYNGLIEPTFAACLIVLDNFCKDFGCSVVMIQYQQCLGFQKILFDK